jgi:hypothetical protein
VDGYDGDGVVVAISRDGSRGSAISHAMIFALEDSFHPAAPDHESDLVIPDGRADFEIRREGGHPRVYGELQSA